MQRTRLATLGAWPMQSQRRWQQDSGLHTASLLGIWVGEPTNLAWPFLPLFRSRKDPSGLGLHMGGQNEDCIQSSLLLGANLSGLSARSYFPQHSIYFPQRPSWFSYFLQHSEARAPRLQPMTFPVDEIRSKRGSH
jgi:hypothetical protein